VKRDSHSLNNLFEGVNLLFFFIFFFNNSASFLTEKSPQRKIQPINQVQRNKAPLHNLQAPIGEDQTKPEGHRSD
jgi:hypothetical protein